MTAFHLVFITDRRQHSTVYRRRAFPAAAVCMKQFAEPRYFCTFDACLPVAPHVSHTFSFLSTRLYSARAVTLILDTLIVLLIYLLG